jgi:hypothetical protein
MTRNDEARMIQPLPERGQSPLNLCLICENLWLLATTLSKTSTNDE